MADEPETPGYPDNYEFRLAPDKRLFAIWEPGNEPWWVVDGASRGRWLGSAEMDALGWTRFLPAAPAVQPDPGSST